MAKFSGFTCDSCGEIFGADSRVRKVVTFYRSLNGTSDSYEQDLCQGCAPDPAEAAGQMRPVKKRKHQAHIQ